MKSFYQFMEDKSNPQDAQGLKSIPQNYGGSPLRTNSPTIQILGQIVRVLQHHTRAILTLLEHHSQILGNKHNADYQAGGNLNQSGEQQALQKLSDGYKLLTGLLGKLNLAQEKDRDLMLFMKELDATIREGQNISMAFRSGMDEEHFDYLKMNYQKLVRLLQEALGFVEKSKHGKKFSASFGQVQQHPVNAGWQQGNDVVDFAQGQSLNQK